MAREVHDVLPSAKLVCKMHLNERFRAAWRFCLSFRKSEWELADYPVTIREQSLALDSGVRFKSQRYVARVMKWWVVTGGGDTAREAMQDLAVHFDRMKADRLRQGKSLPRPGTDVPIEFASSDRVYMDPELRDEFIRRVLGFDWAFVSDESSLWDFHTNENNDSFHARIKEIYGLDVSDLKSGNIAEILERIAASSKQ
jgi:hypothetical protein